MVENIDDRLSDFNTSWVMCNVKTRYKAVIELEK